MQRNAHLNSVWSENTLEWITNDEVNITEVIIIKHIIIYLAERPDFVIDSDS